MTKYNRVETNEVTKVSNGKTVRATGKVSIEQINIIKIKFKLVQHLGEHTDVFFPQVNLELWL